MWYEVSQKHQGSESWMWLLRLSAHPQVHPWNVPWGLCCWVEWNEVCRARDDMIPVLKKPTGGQDLCIQSNNKSWGRFSSYWGQEEEITSVVRGGKQDYLKKDAGMIVEWFRFFSTEYLLFKVQPKWEAFSANPTSPPWDEQWELLSCLALSISALSDLEGAGWVPLILKCPEPPAHNPWCREATWSILTIV